MHEQGHRARKRFGQNFLHSDSIIRQIVEAIHPLPNQHLVEIGPGMGAITSSLLESGAELNAIELDRDLVPRLIAKFDHLSNFHIHQGDALKFDFRQLQPADGGKLRILGNLPYNISTPLIFHLITYSDLVEDMHLMLQAEVVHRLAAQPGEKAYGRLSVMVQYYCDVESLIDVGPWAFNPPPKVDSAVVRLRLKDHIDHPVDDIKQLKMVVTNAFNQRRKTLRNSLKNVLSAEQIEALGIDTSRRPDTVTLAEYVAISNYISRQKHSGK